MASTDSPPESSKDMHLDSRSDMDDSFNDTDMDNVTGPGPEAMEAISALQVSLEQNPNQYEQHIQLISLLKDSDMLDELRNARESMSKTFPLAEGLWLDWIKDEVSLAISEEEKKRVLDLYEKATVDYLSITIWKSYVDYAIEEHLESMEDPDEEPVLTEDEVRTICHRAIKFTEYHIPESHTIWNAWMDFELQQLESQESPSQDHINKLKSSFQERLNVPHSDIDGTLSKLSSFMTKYANSEYESFMAQSSKKASKTRTTLERLSYFEEQLIATGNSLEVFMAYLDHERQQTSKSPPRSFGRIRTLFERALVVHCLVPSVWNDYLSFLMSPGFANKDVDLNPTEILSIAERSRRNCPWSGDLWENRILLLEMYSRPLSDIEELVNKATADAGLLASPTELVKVLLARNVHVFRKAARDEEGHARVRECFKQSTATVQAAGGDPYYKLERQWIELEAGVLGDHKKARSLWEFIVTNQKTLSENWIGFTEFEKRIGNVKGARLVFGRACMASNYLDWPERVHDAWLAFERVHGDVHEHKDALTKCRAAMKGVEAKRSKAAFEQQAYYDTSADITNTAAPEVNVEKPTTSEKVTPQKGTSEKVTFEKVTSEKKKRKGSVAEDSRSTKSAKIEETSAKPPLIHVEDKVQEKSSGESASKPTEDPDLKRLRMTISRGRHENTCFVTNFPVGTTDKQLKAMFAKYGSIERCNIGGKNRTVAYVQFTTPEEAHAALELDGHDMGHRRGLVVKISDTSLAQRHEGPAPKPNVSLHELHVKKFPNEMKESELKKLFSLYAMPTDVFIQRVPASEGGAWANVKFASEEDAATAMALNGHEYYGEHLLVTRREFHMEKRKNRAARREEKHTQKIGQEEKSTGDPGQEAASSSSNSAMPPPPPPSTSATSNTTEAPQDSSPSSSTVTTEPKAEKPVVKATLMSMAPRHVARKPMASRGGRAPRPAFQAHPASTTPIAGNATTGSTSLDPSASEGTSTSAPKSNADFREKWLSGKLKREPENP